MGTTKRRALWLWTLCLFAAVLSLSSSADAQSRRRRRDRWGNTLSFGGTAGLGSPLGLAGAFLEYRPWKHLSASVGVGGGGSFGPAGAATLYIDPLVLRGFSLGVAASISHNISIVRGEVVAGRASLPNATNWVSVEGQVQFRPSRSLMVRIGVGYGWLLDTAAFRLGTDSEISAANLPRYAFITPIDAVRSAARNETLGTAYFHVDLAPVWRL